LQLLKDSVTKQKKFEKAQNFNAQFPIHYCMTATNVHAILTRGSRRQATASEMNVNPKV